MTVKTKKSVASQNIAVQNRFSPKIVSL